jgi:polar amino acid transport system permease protein
MFSRMPAFDFSMLASGPYHDMLVAGLMMSVRLWGLTFVFALPLAIAVALVRMAPWRVLRWTGFAFVEVQRNVPLIAHMLFWYFAAPECLPDAIRQWLYDRNIEFIAAAVSLTLYTGAFMSEDVRSGIRSVPRGQFDAARALGFSPLAVMRMVILPQALRAAVPPLLSQTLNLWKDTSIATVIGTAEMMYQAAKVETASFRSFEAFSFATASYLSISIILTGLAVWYQHRHPIRPA